MCRPRYKSKVRDVRLALSNSITTLNYNVLLPTFLFRVIDALRSHRCMGPISIGVQLRRCGWAQSIENGSPHVQFWRQKWTHGSNLDGGPILTWHQPRLEHHVTTPLFEEGFYLRIYGMLYRDILTSRISDFKMFTPFLVKMWNAWEQIEAFCMVTVWSLRMCMDYM